MNIRSLLIGSAAAMVAVSGAQAADAVVVEPEPVEYVRICDAYGAGFFYIPGTETCLRFSGYVRSQFSVYDIEADDGTGEYSNSHWSTRSRIDVDTRNETDWGTLRAVIRLQSSNGTDDGAASNFEVDNAYITVAGLRVGIATSIFNANYAAGMNLEGVPQIGEDGVYGYTNGHVLDYTYAVDGLTFTVGVEDTSTHALNQGANGADASDATALAKIQYAGDFGSVGIVGEWGASTDNGGEEDAYKAYATLDLSEFIPGGILGGFYMWQDDLAAGSTLAANNGNRRLGAAENAWGVGFQMNLTDNVEFVAFHNQVNYDAAISPFDATLTTIGLNWYPIAGLKVFGAYSFGDTFIGGPYNAGATVANGAFTAGESADFDQILVGIRRNF